MKPTVLLIFSFLFVLVSCSPSDNDSPPIDEPIVDYFPLVNGNYWVYDVSGSDNLSGRDSLYVANDTVINSKTYKKFKTKILPTGLYSNSLNKNGLRKDGNKLLLSGSAEFAFAEALPVALSLNDFVVFQENASANQQLSSVSGTINQEFEGIPLKIDYILKTTAMASLPTFTSPDQTVYSDVKTVKTTLTLTISAELSPEFFPGTYIPVLNTQDVVNSTMYFASSIGVVYTNSTVSYELVGAIAGELGIPESYSQTSQEVLDTYEVD